MKKGSIINSKVCEAFHADKYANKKVEKIKVSKRYRYDFYELQYIPFITKNLDIGYFQRITQ